MARSHASISSKVREPSSRPWNSGRMWNSTRYLYLATVVGSMSSSSPGPDVDPFLQQHLRAGPVPPGALHLLGDLLPWRPRGLLRGPRRTACGTAGPRTATHSGFLGAEPRPTASAFDLMPLICRSSVCAAMCGGPEIAASPCPPGAGPGLSAADRRAVMRDGRWHGGWFRCRSRWLRPASPSFCDLL